LPYYVKTPTTKWWDGYQQQPLVVIDDFRGEIGITHIKTWLDRYPCLVETKGGKIPLATTHWWITSNLEYTEWYKDISDTEYEALKRRLTVRVHFGLQIFS